MARYFLTIFSTEKAHAIATMISDSPIKFISPFGKEYPYRNAQETVEEHLRAVGEIELGLSALACVKEGFDPNRGNNGQ